MWKEKCDMNAIYLAYFKEFSCLSHTKAAPLSMNVSCNTRRCWLTVSLRVFLKKVDGQFVSSSSCQLFVVAFW